MTNIEIRTRGIYDSLSNSEKKVAAYFLDNMQSVFDMPIARLAEGSGVSQVAWVRFCKAIGFDGLKDMKKALFGEINDTLFDSSRGGEIVFGDIKDHTSVEEMAHAVKNSTIRAVEDTVKLLDFNTVERAARKIIGADSVKVFGVGASALVAEDLFSKLLRIGKNVCFCRDLHVQLTYAANLSARDAAVFISYSGSTQEVVETLRIAKRCRVPTIGITKFGKNPLALESDYLLLVSSPEIDRRSGAMSSRMAQLTVVDILFTAIANKDYEHAEARLENSYNSCQLHKLSQQA